MTTHFSLPQLIIAGTEFRVFTSVRQLQRLVESKLDWSCAALTARLCNLICSPMQPSMNAFTERVIGTIRREALDHFLLFSEKHVRNIITQYVEYYNHFRSHQSIEGIPEGDISRTSGNIKKEQILGGLHHNYYRSSA